jgi:hypothetical protein
MYKSVSRKKLSWIDEIDLWNKEKGDYSAIKIFLFCQTYALRM